MENASGGLNNTIFTDPLGRSNVQIGFEVFFAVVICATSLLGNVLVIYVIHRDPKLRTITNVFIENLAWTDVSMATLVMPFWLLSVYHGQWAVSAAFCPWSGAMLLTFGITSILTMGAIAGNRYLKIVRNQLYSRVFINRRTAWLYASGVWLTAVLLSTPPLYGWGVMGYHPGFSLCTMKWELKHISYVIVIIGGVVTGTTLVIFCCYYKIYKTVQNSAANIMSHNNSSGIHRQRATSSSTDIKLLKSTFTVVCFFLVTWLPVSGVVMYETAGGQPPRLVFAFVVFLMFTSSLGNPVIYGILNPRFRRAFLHAVRCAGFDSTGNTSWDGSRDQPVSTCTQAQDEHRSKNTITIVNME